MKEDWRDLFSFNHRERKGIVVLLSLLVLILAANVLYPILFPVEKLEVTVTSLAISEKEPIRSTSIPASKRENPIIEYPQFRFDPNTVSQEDFKKLGFKAYQSKMLMNYREAGGFFKEKSDFHKLYFVNDSIYDRHVDFIFISNNFAKADTVPTNKRKKWTATDGREKVGKLKMEHLGEKREPFFVKMNQSDTSEWKRFYGIGSGYANRIVKYRDIIGGYVRKDQLLEVYGFDTALYHKISDQLIVDSTFIKRINLNTVSTNRLSKHPYITWNMARVITDSRVQDGRFETKEDLLKRNLLNEVLYRKIAEYLEVY